ncbi:location of vulva defective 1-like [Pollicipes pollicipes]|uniref:location of vulva defective 1-like n=1 Tax=Pollicipes pollicipes TaxID=41117 RepID=UPI001884C66A|nr:location of vulva defective 1-like [Pollicipes pollicipes]
MLVVLDPPVPAEVMLQLRLPSAVQLPTNASLAVDFGDGLAMSVSLSDTTINLDDATPSSSAVDGFFVAPFDHSYSSKGIYTATVILSNRVSEQQYSTIIMVEDKIIGLQPSIRQQQDDRTVELETGRGDLSNEYRNDRNLTIFFSLVQGTMTKVTVYNNSETDMEIIYTHVFVDKNNPALETITIHIATNQLLNLSFVAENSYETTPQVVATIAIVFPITEITNLKISMDKLQPPDFKLKSFTVDFETASTQELCLAVKYGDASPRVSYGDEGMCNQMFPDAANMPNELTQPMKLQYQYRSKGTYNVTVDLFNPKDHETYEMLLSVSDLPCTNPDVTIAGASENREEPPHYLMSQNIILRAEITLDCGTTLSTKKRWQAFMMRPGTPRSAFIMYELPSWDKTELLLPSNFLKPGLHKVTFTLTMGENGAMGEDLFQTTAQAYLQVDRTPLYAGMIRGAVSKIDCGWSQKIILDAMTYSTDPDAPEQKDFTYEWYCRRLGETLPRNETGAATVPAQLLSPRSAGGPVPSPDLGGCFGEGPGPLAFSGGRLNISADILQPYRQALTFAFTVVVMKDTRKSEAEVQVAMVDGNPPRIEVQCADAVLCAPAVTGVMVNVQHNLGLRGDCVEYCDPQLTWSWVLSAVDGDTVTPISNQDQYLPISDTNEVRISNKLYSDHPDIKQFHVGLQASNGVVGNPSGTATYFITVNQPPVVDGKLCACQSTSNASLALVGTFSITCQMPVDPEGRPIRKVAFSSDVTGPTGKTESKKLDVISPGASDQQIQITVRPSLGVNQIQYVAEDQQGATARKSVCSISSDMPTEEQYNDFMASDLVRSMTGTGDASTAFAIAQAKGSVTTTATWVTGLSGQQKDDYEVKESAEWAAILKTVLNKAAVGKEELSLVANVVRTSTERASDEVLKLDMENLELVNQLLMKCALGLKDAGFATPEEMQNVLQDVLHSVSIMKKNLVKVARDESCESISPSDLRKAPLMHVENTLDYDAEPKALSYEMELKCNVRDNVLARSDALVDDLTRIETLVEQAPIPGMVANDRLVLNHGGGTTVTTMAPNVSSLNMSLGMSEVKMPDGFDVGDGKPVAVTISDTAVNAKTAVKGAEMVSSESHVVSVGFADRNLQHIPVNNRTPGIELKIPQNNRRGQDGNCSTCPTPPQLVNGTDALKGKFLSIVFSEFNITKPKSAFNIEFHPEGDSVEDFFVMVSFNRMPTLRRHSLFKMVSHFPFVTSPENGTTDNFTSHRLFVSSEWVSNRQGRVFVGVGQFNESSTKYADVMNIVNANRSDFSAFKSQEILRNKLTIDYRLITYSLLCTYFNTTLGEWDNDGLTVITADINSVRCESSHTTSFASGLFVQPNTIDFAYVFANASFTDNMTIYMTLILLLTMYLLLLIWAHWQDKKDVEKLGSMPLPDNKASDKYLYEIMLFTGHKSDAATDSCVSFFLSGDDDETGSRTFGKPNRKFFRKSGQDAFVMSVPGPLGALQYLRIWHDNSGKGRFASWFLQYVLIRDVQTGETTTFVCNQWLGVEYDDGCIDRLIPVAGKEQMREFAHLFPHTSQQTLSDGHLWFSVFLRPPRSRFTRMQRVSCCFALLFLSMMVNAMWYGQVPSKPSTGALKFGPLAVSPEQISVGFMSNIIVFVPSLLIVFLFRKSRPRKLRTSRIDDAMAKVKRDNEERATRAAAIDNSERVKTDDDGTAPAGPSGRKSSKKSKTTAKRRFTLPWWGTIIGWVLCLVCLFGSAFIVYSYGITFGNEKSTKWITSLFISFFSSVLLVQPLKVFLTAIVISAIFKNVNLGSDDANEDEEDPHLSSDEEWLVGHSGKRPPPANAGSPYDKELLKQIRKQRMKEIEMGVIVREIISYALFLWILFVLSYDNRDPNAYFLQKNIQNAFVKEGDLTNFNRWLDFSRVHNTSAFWYWSRNVILQELRAQTWYDGITPAYGLRGFLDDRVNRILGYAMISQVRSLPNTCRIHQSMRSLVGGCHGYTSLVNEDKAHYCANWTTRGSAVDCRRGEYRHTSASDLDSLPLVAKQDVYGGGRYVFRLTGRQSHILAKMTQLEEENWIDELTRAVFVEFSVYNAQVNLFGIGNMYVEITPGGGMHPAWRFDGIRLTRQAGSQLFVIICELVYCLFILYFIVREIRLMCKMKKQYFRNYAVYAEWSIILLSFAGLVVYIMRYVETTQLLDFFKKTYGNGYVGLHYAKALDDLFGYIVGIIVFIATLKFIKLLRFNRRIGMLSATLKQTWGDLTGFFVIFAIAFGSFGLLFNLLLVSAMDDFKTWISAVESCFSMMLGKFHFLEMYRGSILAAIMFFFFALYMNLIFVNVLLTIIIKGFEQVKNDVTKQPNDYEVVEFLVNRFKKFMGIGGNTVSPLKDLVKEHEAGSQAEKGEQNVQALPDKVGQFLEQVNHMYFDGNLELNNKKFLKKTIRQGKEDGHGDQPSATGRRRPKSMDAFQSRGSNLSSVEKELDDV